MKLTGIKTVTVYSWAICEGVFLRYTEDGAAWWSALVQRSGDAASAGGVPLRIATPPA